MVAGDPYGAAQVFTAEASGQVESIALLLGRNGWDWPGDLTFSLRLLSTSGEPGGELGSALLPASLVPDTRIPVLLQARLDGPSVFIEAGMQYCLNTRASSGAWSWHGVHTNPPHGGTSSPPAGYPGGTALTTPDGGASWVVQPAMDLGFQVHLIPEPCAVGVLGMGILGWVGLCRCGRRD